MRDFFEFPVRGTIPQDHGYRILSGLSLRSPFLHGGGVQIAPLGGKRVQGGKSLQLHEGSRLRIRGITREQAHQIMSLGAFWCGDEMISVGPAHRKILRPSGKLSTRLLVLKDTVDETTFIEALKCKLPSTAIVELGRRRALKMKSHHYLGYSVRILGLTAEESLCIQETGLGKFRSMGCGVFQPTW